MTTTEQRLADALRTIDEHCQTGLNSSVYSHWSAALEDAMRVSREALAAYDAQQTETLTIRVNGEAARMALCDCLKGWHARRDGTWHVITTHANRAHMLALINDLGIRAKVMP